MAVGKVYDCIWRWSLRRMEDDGIRGMDQTQFYGFPTVGETYDGLLNDIRRSTVTGEHVLEAIENAGLDDEVFEGSHGGGTGMRSHGFKAGTGTSSRLLTGEDGEVYTLGVIVQNNYGSPGNLQIDGVPVGKMLSRRNGAKIEASRAPLSGKAAEGSTRQPARPDPRSGTNHEARLPRPHHHRRTPPSPPNPPHRPARRHGSRASLRARRRTPLERGILPGALDGELAGESGQMGWDDEPPSLPGDGHGADGEERAS